MHDQPLGQQSINMRGGAPQPPQKARKPLSHGPTIWRARAYTCVHLRTLTYTCVHIPGRWGCHCEPSTRHAHVYTCTHRTWLAVSPNRGTNPACLVVLPRRSVSRGGFTYGSGLGSADASTCRASMHVVRPCCATMLCNHAPCAAQLLECTLHGPLQVAQRRPTPYRALGRALCLTCSIPRCTTRSCRYDTHVGRAPESRR